MTSTISVWRFWTEYVPDPKPEQPLHMRAVDWVEYGPMASRERSTTQAPIRNILDRLMPMTDRSNPAIVLAHERAEIIGRAYKAWKTGNEVPVEGTPLAAWNGVSPEQAEILKVNNVRTVEEVALLTDAHLERIRLPHLRELIKQAQRFVASADTVRYAQELAQRDKTIDQQSVQLDELRSTAAEQAEQIKALIGKVGELAEMVVARDSEPAAVEPANRKTKKAA